MKVIAIDIFDYNNWYRFNIKSVSNDMIIDFDIEDKSLVQKIKMFEEEHDIFFAELPDNLEKYKKNHLYNIPLQDVKSLIPLSEQAKTQLVRKMPDIVMYNPLDKDIYQQIINERNYLFSKIGGEMVLSIFDIEKKTITPYEHIFLDVMEIYPEKSDTFISAMIHYERTRPFPLINSGFLFDTGAVLKQYYTITNQIKEINSSIEALSLFCYKNRLEENAFSSFVKEYEQSDKLKELNKLIPIPNNEDDINKILVISFYFKFRSLIRERKYVDFQKHAEKYFSKEDIKKEMSIALFWVGLFFGVKEFRDIFYERKLVGLKSLTPKIVNSEQKPIQKKEQFSTKSYSEIWEQIENELPNKNITKTLLKKIKKSFSVFERDNNKDEFLKSLENLEEPKGKNRYSKSEIIKIISNILDKA
ncbi:hypothetical protein ACILDT_11035 [Capnocytophaga canis]|uniref:hypothetical protein n=1 Tax=Capnocytophaga canis TaxID=1848903 RepID=UPI0037D4C67A